MTARTKCKSHRSEMERVDLFDGEGFFLDNDSKRPGYKECRLITSPTMAHVCGITGRLCIVYSKDEYFDKATDNNSTPDKTLYHFCPLYNAPKELAEKAKAFQLQRQKSRLEEKFKAIGFGFL